MAYMDEDYTDLVGTKIFKGVAYIAGGTLFKLDDKVYFLYEDEDDGYRSHGLLKGEAEPSLYEKLEFNLEHTPIEVDVERINSSFMGIHIYGSAALNSRTPLPICELGTDNTDDYYPMYTSHFDSHQATEVRRLQFEFISETILLDNGES